MTLLHFIQASLAGLLLTSTALAHDPGLSGLAVKSDASGQLEIVATFARRDIQSLGAKTEKQTLQLAPAVIRVQAGDRQLTPAQVETDLHAANNDISFRLLFPSPTDGEKLTVQSLLIDQLSPGHRQYAAVRDASDHLLSEQLLQAGASTVQVELTGPPPPATFPGFVMLGIEHILTGYDHLLFLFALLIVSHSFLSSAKLISCFTVGHSITLALATFNLVNLSSRLVEPLIAGSIVYVAVENIARHGAPRGRYLLTFGFGLIHGLGFASVLREMGVGSGGEGVVMPLLGFNLGVESGQIAVAALILPILGLLRARPVWVARWVPACSAVVALAGAYWLVERVMG